MRTWYKFLILDKFNKDIKDRFLFTNYQLIKNNKIFEDVFNFDNFKKKETFFKQYNFLKNNLDPNKETLFVGSSWGGGRIFFKG